MNTVQPSLLPIVESCNVVFQEVASTKQNKQADYVPLLNKLVNTIDRLQDHLQEKIKIVESKRKSWKQFFRYLKSELQFELIILTFIIYLIEKLLLILTKKQKNTAFVAT